MITVRRLVLILGLLAMFFVVPVASAHRPEEGVDAGSTLIPDPTTSFAYYRQLDNPVDVHTYTFEGQVDQFFHAGINIPQIRGLGEFRVTLALLGPGFPEISSSEQESAPHSHSDSGDEHHEHGESIASLPDGFALLGNNGIIIENQAGEDFFEPFTQTRYWGRQQIDLNLPESGTYTLVIWNPDGESGKYVLDTGTEEVFGPADLLRFPIWWFNTRLYFEQGPSLAGAASVLFFGIAGMVAYRVRKK
jgi:hypothetical protein